MNEKRKPNFQDLSYYYDNLLDPESRKELEASLKRDGEEERLIHFFARIDSSLTPPLSEDQIDSLLSDNLKNIHERLIQDDHHFRKESISVWDWLLMPRNLLAGLATLLILFGVFSTMNPFESILKQPADGLVAAFPTPSAPSGEDQTVTQQDSHQDNQSDELATSNPVTPLVDEAQKQVILAAAGLAKSALASGVDYAKQKSKPLGETLKILPQTADLGIAFQSLTQSSSESAESQNDLSPTEQLARAGTRQLAIGLGASLLSLFSVI